MIVWLVETDSERWIFSKKSDAEQCVKDLAYPEHQMYELEVIE